MAHRRAKLTPVGRRLLVDRVLVMGWSASEAAKAAGVSRATCYKWIRRFRQEGEVGLSDRSSRPHRCPNALGPRAERQILRARRRLKRGPHHVAPLLGRPRSTVYAVLRRHGMSRLDQTDRPTGVTIRYEKERPGELVHIDVKKLARIPPGGGWRIRVAARRRSSRAAGTTTCTPPSMITRASPTLRCTPTSGARPARCSWRGRPPSTPSPA